MSILKKLPSLFPNSNLQSNPNAQGFQDWQATQEGLQMPQDPVSELRQLAAKTGQRKAAKVAQAPVEFPIPTQEDLGPAPEGDGSDTLRAFGEAPEMDAFAKQADEADYAREQLRQSNFKEQDLEVPPEMEAQAPQPEPQQANNGLQGFNNEMNDAALSQALDEQRRLQERALQARLAGGFADAAALSVGKGPVSNQSMYSALDDYAKGATDKVEGRRKGMQQEESYKQSQAKTFEDADAMARADFNSDISKSMRQFAKDKLGMPITGKESANNLKGIVELYDRYVARQDKREDQRLKAAEIAATKNSESDRKANQFMSAQQSRFTTEVNRDLSKLEEKMTALGGAQQLADLATTNPTAAAALGTKVAKAYGEVGALTENDVTRYIKDPRISAQVAQTFRKVVDGTLNPSTAKYLKETLQAMAAMDKDRKEFVVSRKAKQFSRNFTNSLKRPTSMNDALYNLGFEEYMKDDPEYDLAQSRDNLKAKSAEMSKESVQDSPKAKPSEKAATSSNEDKMAIEWASRPENAKDPRALRIKQEHGIK